MTTYYSGYLTGKTTTRAGGYGFTTGFYHVPDDVGGKEKLMARKKKKSGKKKK